MITRINENGLTITVMGMSEYRAKKRKQFNKYKQSPEYQLWENSHKNNKT